MQLHHALELWHWFDRAGESDEMVRTIISDRERLAND